MLASRTVQSLVRSAGNTTARSLTKPFSTLPHEYRQLPDDVTVGEAGKIKAAQYLRDHRPEAVPRERPLPQNPTSRMRDELTEEDFDLRTNFRRHTSQRHTPSFLRRVMLTEPIIFYSFVFGLGGLAISYLGPWHIRRDLEFKLYAEEVEAEAKRRGLTEA
eukprot:TRINITY_DN15461_c0_g1_i2.p1 TRINITY_DN15461_c0_g1~~TRINITY_DN15461_c0_g1_i2.p1  ORF type:complete len:161 (+),score=16.14 TRINITY_DN15461_c0_g1_i2:222-704(+)